MMTRQIIYWNEPKVSPKDGVQVNFVFVIPSLDPKALKGAIAADLVVFYSSLESKAEADRNIMSHLDEYVMRAEVNDREHGLFNLILTNVSQAPEIQRWGGGATWDQECLAGTNRRPHRAL